MKNKNIIKWTIVSVLFLLAGLSILCLGIQVKEQLFVQSKNDDENVIAQRDQICNKIDTLIKLEKVLNSKLIADTTEIAKIDRIIKNNDCSSDSIKDLIETKLILDSLIKENQTKKDSIAQQITILKKQYSYTQKTIQKVKAKTPFPSSFSITTIILIVITFILVTLFIVSFILFSGILKLFKTNKKMEEFDNPTTNLDFSEKENLLSNEEIENVTPKPDLTNSITFVNDSRDCILDKRSFDKEIHFSQSKEQQNYVKNDDSNVYGSKLIYSETPISNKQDLEIKNDEATDNSVISDSSSQIRIKKQVENKRVRKFTNFNNVIGISYQGDNHVKSNPVVPCQDCHCFTKVNDIWNIAIVSDGAGSKEHSDVGSDAVCAAFTFYLSHMFKTDKRFVDGDIPNERIWDLEFRALLTKFQNELKVHKAFKSYDFGSLAATIVLLAYSPKGYIFAHVGDGRAGVKINGKWKSILTPHKGEEANQTIFSTTIEFINKPTLTMSGVFVPETKVEQCNIEAFVLMSDGCEDGAWATYQKVVLPDGDFKVEDVNQPRPMTLEELMNILDENNDDHKESIINFITGYNKGFKTEGDDKTILIGRVK